VRAGESRRCVARPAPVRRSDNCRAIRGKTAHFAKVTPPKLVVLPGRSRVPERRQVEAGRCVTAIIRGREIIAASPSHC